MCNIISNWYVNFFFDKKIVDDFQNGTTDGEIQSYIDAKSSLIMQFMHIMEVTNNRRLLYIHLTCILILIATFGVALLHNLWWLSLLIIAAKTFLLARRYTVELSGLRGTYKMSMSLLDSRITSFFR